MPEFSSAYPHTLRKPKMSYDTITDTEDEDRDGCFRTALNIGFAALAIVMLITAIAIAQCGVERKDVKDLQDGFNPLPAVTMTVHEIHALKRPKWSTKLPRQPNEKITARISGNIVEFGSESDHDFHVVVEQNGETIVCEVPSPECVPEHAQQFAAIRTFLLMKCGSAGKIHKLKTPVPVTFTGIIFQDRPHGLNKPTGFELHPLLSAK